MIFSQIVVLKAKLQKNLFKTKEETRVARKSPGSWRESFPRKDAKAYGRRSDRRMQRRDRLRRGYRGSMSGCAEGPDCRREKREARGPKA